MFPKKKPLNRVHITTPKEMVDFREIRAGSFRVLAYLVQSVAEFGEMGSKDPPVAPV
jgi:hypothetical protein